MVSWRTIVQDWRSPGYIYSKLILVISSSLFIGFSFFKAKNNLQGLQSQMLAVFMFFVPFTTFIDQMLPYFVKHRAVYEVSSIKNIQLVCIYCWSNHFRNSFQIVVGTISYFCWYYPVGLYANAEPTDSVNSRGVLMWMLLTAFYVYTSTMGQLAISFNELIDNAANLATTLFTLCLMFCGVLAGPNVIPGF